jgi:SNF2 family DNA or RNA helicase
VLADDMGLGKTVRAIGLAELLAREIGVRRVLIVCPASVKSQWRSEIRRFSNRDCQLVLGAAADRSAQYGADCFFKVCNYEQVLRDVLSIERVPWNLIVLDEGQRIKNWETRTTQTIKSGSRKHMQRTSGDWVGGHSIR